MAAPCEYVMSAYNQHKLYLLHDIGHYVILYVEMETDTVI